jgi:GNAT superfamily N-acetyltransferase
MIKKATMEDIESIMEMVGKIIVEMNSYNNFQWDESYPQAQDFASDIQKEELYVAVRESKVVGFVCINRDEPKEYEGLKWSSSNEALVIHRMGVNPDYRNAGIGTELVGFADELSNRFNLNYLKTDTYSLNVKVQGLFERCGYRFVGEMSFLSKEKPFYCYEKIQSD